MSLGRGGASREADDRPAISEVANLLIDVPANWQTALLSVIITPFPRHIPSSHRQSLDVAEIQGEGRDRVVQKTIFVTGRTCQGECPDSVECVHSKGSLQS